MGMMIGLILFLLLAVLLLLLRCWNARKRKQADRPDKYLVSFDSDGFKLIALRGKDRRVLNGMHWDEIHRVIAFKRDLYTEDCICVFIAGADGMGIELDEEMEWFYAFVGQLPDYLFGCKQTSEWLESVALPAFETNKIEIYARCAGCAGAAHQ